MNKSKPISGAEFWPVAETLIEHMGTVKSVELLKNNPELSEYIFRTFAEVPDRILVKLIDFNFIDMFETALVNMSKNPLYEKSGWHDPLGQCINSVYAKLYKKYKERYDSGTEQNLKRLVAVVEKNSYLFSAEALSVFYLRRDLTVNQSIYADEVYKTICEFIDTNRHLIGGKKDNLITDDFLELIIEMSIFIKPNNAHIVWEKLLDCCDGQKEVDTQIVDIINKCFIETYKNNYGKTTFDRILVGNEVLKARVYRNKERKSKKTVDKNEKANLYHLVIRRIQEGIGTPSQKCKRRLRNNINQIEQIYRKANEIDDGYALYNKKRILDDDLLFFIMGYIITDRLFDDSDVLLEESLSNQDEQHNYEFEEDDIGYEEIEEVDDFDYSDSDDYDWEDTEEYDSDDYDYDMDSDDMTFQDDFGYDGDDMYSDDGEFID